MSPHPTPEQLVTRIAGQDRSAFEELFRQFAPRILGLYARSGLPPDVREELLQEVMLRIWRKAPQFEATRASATTWMFAIARNARVDHLRRPVVQAQVEALDPAFVDTTALGPDDVVARRQLARSVRDALDDLPSEQASILEAAYFQHKTLKAIASEWGLALGTVKSRVRLAFRRLRGTLEEQP